MWNVPERRKRVFVGRNGLLADLHTRLQTESTAVLIGHDGMGKTSVAAEYAYRHSADYDAVWWVRAERPEALAADYAGLAPALGLSVERAPDQALQVDTARRWLEGHGRWLLVFDDAAGVDSWQPYLPAGGRGHVVVTARTPVPGWERSTLAVGELSHDDAVTFLLQRTGEDDLPSALAIADALRDLPLALDHAAAYAQGKGTLAEYLVGLRRHAEDLFLGGEPADYAYTVASTLGMSLDAARRSSRAAGEVMRLCAHLAPDDIPHDLLLAHPDALRGGLRKPARDQLTGTVAALSSFSLVERLPDALSVHRLVQGVTRDDLSPKAQRRWAGSAVRLMASAFPASSDDSGNWPTCERLLPHALVAAERAEQLGTELKATSRVLNGVALYLRARSQFQTARAAFERALAIDEAAYGPDHPSVGADLNNLGLVLRDLGDLAGAKERLERALAIGEAADGPDHPVIGTRLNNLGLVLRDLGDLDGARERFERGLAIDQTAFGPDHPAVGTDVNNLALVLHDLGDLARAKALLERAVAIAEAAHGPDHPIVGTRLDRLALVLQDLGDLAGAKDRLERGLAITVATLGPHHPKVATDLNNLALALQDLGDLAGAKQGFERALAIDEAAYGPDHPEVGADLNNLAVVLQDLGDLAGARAHLERALAIDEAALGHDHPEVGTDLNNLALVLQDLGDFALAAEGFRRAVAIAEAAYGPRHPKVGTVLKNLALVLQDLGDLAGAKQCLQRAVAIDEAAYGPGHPLEGARLNDLAAALRELGE